MRSTVLLLVLLPVVAQAQTFRDSVITANASRTSRIVADRATLYLVVEGSAETAPDAVTRVETKLRAVTDALKGLGSRVEADRPIGYTVGPAVQQGGFPQVQTPPTNVARSLIRVQLSRADQVSHVVAAALAAGAASTSSLTFESSVADSVRRVRIAETLAAAREDAEAMARALGGRLGALVDVSTASNPQFQQPMFLNFDNRFGSQQASTPDVAVTTSVTVRYRLLR